MFLIYQSHADPTLPKCQIKASAQCTFNKAKSTYDQSKRGKGGDRSSGDEDTEVIRGGMVKGTMPSF